MVLFDWRLVLKMTGYCSASVKIRIPIRILLISVVAIGVALWLDQPNHPGINIGSINREITTRLGLDLIGGTQTLLEADLPENSPIEPEAMKTARDIVERRVNGLGVAEAVVQLAGDRRILVELPGVDDPGEAVATIKGTALLEFVDFSSLEPSQAIEFIGAQIVTDFGQVDDNLLEPTDSSTENGVRFGPNGVPIFHTVMTGAELKSASAGQDPVTGEALVSFELTDTGADIFGEYTASHINEILAIVLDKEVISSPQIDFGNHWWRRDYFRPFYAGDGQPDGCPTPIWCAPYPPPSD